jgi:GDPmannose 4,6-dehydratase
MKQKAIITGVTGQMGSCFTDFLLAKGLRVIGTVRRLSVSNHENIDHLKDNKDFSLATMDLGDPQSIEKLIREEAPDYFINCAANSFVGSSWDLPVQHIMYNGVAVLHQLEAIRKFSPNTRYANFGSSEEMGDVLYSPQDEKHPPRARSPYAASKVYARQIMKVYRESYGIFAVAPYCYNYEGERRGKEFVTRKISVGVARLAKELAFVDLMGEPSALKLSAIPLGNLNAKRDWSYAKDIADGVWRMLNNSRPKDYILASGRTHSIKEFIEKAFEVANIPGSWSGEGENEKFSNSYGDMVIVSKDFYRPNEVNLLLGDSTLARTELGWEPKVQFEELVKLMVESDMRNLK